MELKHLHEKLEGLEKSMQQLLRESFQKEHLTMKEAAAYLGIKIEQMYELNSKHTFPLFKPSGKLAYVKLDDLKAWIEAAKIPSAAEIDRQTNLMLLNSKAV